ncbi:MAG: ribonuclease P protein component [Bacteroidales bacterium]
MNRNRLSFDKSAKLCSVTRISEVFREGKIVFNYPFKVCYLVNGTDKSKVLISVPKRSFKKAVQRNRIKRVIREALRLAGFQEFYSKGLDICIIYIGKELPLFNKVSVKIKNVLEKIHIHSQENSDSAISGIN